MCGHGIACLLLCSQDASTMSDIADKFQITIPEIQYDDEAAFIDVLHKAGLTDELA